MGTVLSFSPRERRPVYSTHHHSSGLSTSGSADYPLNNFSYEQLNNVKNRENNKSLCPVPNSNANLVLMGQTHNNHINNNGSINHPNASERCMDSARILSEKNALEKNLKKHSLFINALSWKRLAASHGKKKLDNNKNKAANLPTAATFRQPLVDAIHPLVVDKNKNIQHNPHEYYTPGAQKTLLALDLVRANNTNNVQQPDKLQPKLPLSLPLPIQTAITHPQHSHGPRKTVIQV